MATLTPTLITSAGVKQTLAAATSCGDRFKATSPHEFVRVANGAGAPITVTIPTVRAGWAAPVNSVLPGSASSAQAVVNVAVGEGGKFSAGMLCTIKDSAARERCTVLSVNTDAVTLTKNLTNSYTNGRGAVLWVGGADIVVTVAATGSAANDITIAFDSTAPIGDFTDDDGYVNIAYSAVTTVTVGLFTAY